MMQKITKLLLDDLKQSRSLLSLIESSYKPDNSITYEELMKMHNNDIEEVLNDLLRFRRTLNSRILEVLKARST